MVIFHNLKNLSLFHLSSILLSSLFAQNARLEKSLLGKSHLLQHHVIYSLLFQLPYLHLLKSDHFLFASNLKDERENAHDYQTGVFDSFGLELFALIVLSTS